MGTPSNDLKIPAPTQEPMGFTTRGKKALTDSRPGLEAPPAEYYREK